MKRALCTAVLLFTQSCGPSTAPDSSPIEFVPDRDAYYGLQTVQSAQANRCLEGNRFVPTATLEGAAFMDFCQDVTGQSWRFVPAGDGLYRMQTFFLEDEGKCLESNSLAVNSVAPGAVARGGAYMTDCTGEWGELWFATKR